MRERIEQVGDILLAAAHADHHVEAAEIDKIEEILKKIWREEPTPDQVVRRVTEFREGESVDEAEMARLGSMLRDLQPREELPASLVQRLADFDPATFDIDEAVGPFLPESIEFKRRLLELAVAVLEQGAIERLVLAHFGDGALTLGNLRLGLFVEVGVLDGDAGETRQVLQEPGIVGAKGVG